MNLSEEKIIQMALEFGWSYYDEYKFNIDELQEFVNAICAAEREACASTCDGWSHADGDVCAAAIRARSGQ